MQVEITNRTIRTMADRIVKADSSVPKPHALEMLSHGLGYRNFDTLSGLLSKEDKSSKRPARRGADEAGKLNESTDLWISARVCASDEEGPEFVQIEITPEFLEELEKHRALCEQFELEEVVVSRDPSGWDLGSDPEDYYGPYRVEAWELVVSCRSFLFRGLQKYSDNRVESGYVDIEDMLALLHRKTSGDPQFSWIDNALYCDGSSASDLHERVTGSDDEDEDDNSEEEGSTCV